MTLATMTSKGQLTVPKEIREKLGLKPGDRVDMVIESDGSVRMRPASLKARDTFGILAKYGHQGKPDTPEEMDESIKEYIRKKFP